MAEHSLTPERQAEIIEEMNRSYADARRLIGVAVAHLVTDLCGSDEWCPGQAVMVELVAYDRPALMRLALSAIAEGARLSMELANVRQRAN